jgi:RNA polymerase sigma factor (sigma-70 family)
MRLSEALTSLETSGLLKVPRSESALKSEAQASAEARTSAEIEQEVLAAYDQFAVGLFRYTRALGKDTELAQDAVQEAFLRYYLALLRGEAIRHSRAWVFRVARNYVLDRLKEYAYRNCISLDAKEVTGLNDPRGAVEDQSRMERLGHALRLLSPRELECLRLRIEGLKNREIAEVLNLRLGTVCALLARGLNRIRKACDR